MTVLGVPDYRSAHATLLMLVKLIAVAD